MTSFVQEVGHSDENALPSLARSGFILRSSRPVSKKARGHRGFRLWGVTEAILGALAWTLLLILAAVLLAWNGIDIFEYYHKATGVLPPHK